jgi:hypothetical protein
MNNNTRTAQPSTLATRCKQVLGGAAIATLSFAASATTDPSTQIIAEIDKGKGYGVAAAVAFAVAVWAIRAIAMARRKG